MKQHLKSLKFMYYLDIPLNLIASHHSKRVGLVLSKVLDAVLPEKGRKNRFSRFSAWIITLWMDSEIKRTHSSRIRRTLLMSRKFRFHIAGRVRIRGYRWVVGRERVVDDTNVDLDDRNVAMLPYPERNDNNGFCGWKLLSQLLIGCYVRSSRWSCFVT